MSDVGDKLEGGIFDVWHVDHDPCEICGATATEVLQMLEHLQLKRLCPKHADEAETAHGGRMPRGGATCEASMKQTGITCGAVATHVALIGEYDANDQPETSLVALCPEHALELDLPERGRMSPMGPPRIVYGRAGAGSVFQIRIPPGFADEFRREATKTLAAAEDQLADDHEVGDDEAAAASRERLKAAERLNTAVVTGLTFEVDMASAMREVVRQTAREGLWQAARVLAEQAETREIHFVLDFTAARNAHAEAAFWLRLLEGLDSASWGEAVMG
jgi:hypothetical protein